MIPVVCTRLLRLYRQVQAAALGYFWLPCPSCGSPFSGREWLAEDCVGAHFASVPTARPGSSVAICPACTVAGLGCRAHAQLGSYHLACGVVPLPT